MHFILEEKEKELIGNIKLSSVTAENNLVFCSVACDLVRSLRWQGSACLECKAHRCLGFYSLLWSNLFSVVLAAGAAQNTGFGKGPGGTELRGNAVARAWKCFPWRCSRSQETNMSSCCSSGGLEQKSIPKKNKAEQGCVWEFLQAALEPRCSQA